jgi:hypothetical protein
MATGYPDWLRAYLLLGQDESGDAQVLSVDSDGFLTAVLKGLLGTTLTTIAVDANGYLATYTLDDESQWGHVVRVGNAELAARLGSIATYDWRGQVVYATDFANGLGGLYTSALGTDGEVVLDASKHVSGGYSAKLVGGSASDYNAEMYIGFDIPPSDITGFCIRWASDSAFAYLEIGLHVYDGAIHHRGAIRISTADNELQYQDTDDSWEKIEDYTPVLTGYTWQGLKVVIDIDDGQFIRVLAAGTEHDISSETLYTAADLTAPHIEAWVRVVSESAENRYVWVDSMVLTVAETA